jgi:hypothetical protein
MNPQKKQAQLSWVFENPLYANVLHGALKALKWVAIATFDFKLATITQMLETWVSDKEREWESEQERRKQERQQLGLY